MSVQDQDVIDTDALINRCGISRVQWLVGILSGCALLVEGFNTSAIGYIAPQITKLWHVPNGTLGTILSADMVGLLLGYLFLSPLSARFGHKRMIVACTAAFGIATFLTITAGGVPQLLLFRFLTGIGVGGAMPSAVALTGEYFPERLRSTSITLIYIGFSLGQIAAGVVSNLLLQDYGWRAVLASGGLTTIGLSALFAFALPESLEFLINRGNAAEQARRIVARIVAKNGPAISGLRLVCGQSDRTVGVAQLVENGRFTGTMLIWAGMFMNLMIYFFLQKWLTSLIVQSGLSQQVAITATTIGLAGGIVAAVIIGPLMDRFGPYAVVAGLFGLSAFSVVLMARILVSPLPLVTIAGALLVGFCLSGGQKANNALSVFFYPTALRGTGIGWSLGIGRIGGVLGPFLGGVLLAGGWSPSDLFYAAALPMLLGMAAIAAMGVIYSRAPAIAAAHRAATP